MRQATLLEYGPHIVTVYVPMRRYPYKTKRGLAEAQLKKRLEKQGWKVWRGGFIHAVTAEVYPNVKRKYEELANLIKKNFGEQVLDLFCYMCIVHHGMPDFICYNPTIKQFKFVECKLGYEGLSGRQVQTIQKLRDHGFQVEIHKLVEPPTKTRKAIVNILTNEKQIIEKEMKLGFFMK